MPQISLVALRGPLLLGAILGPILWPYLAQISIETWIKMFGLFLGLVLLAWDLGSYAMNQLRVNLSNGLDTIVLDDVLRAIYDPTEGIIASFFATFVGNMAMYCLPMTVEQRTRLVEATLWTDRQEASVILSAGGGCKRLLPAWLQAWLENGESTQSDEDPGVETMDSDSCMSQKDQESESTEVPFTPERHSQSAEASCAAPLEPRERVVLPQNLCIPPTTDPALELFQICKELAVDRMRDFAARWPDQRLETLATGSAGAFFLASTLARRLRNKTLLVVLGGTAVGSFSALLLKHCLMGSVRDWKSARLISLAILSRIASRLRSLSEPHRRKVQGIVAALVMYYFRKRLVPVYEQRRR